MLKVLSAEIRYHGWFLLSILGLIPVLALYRIYADEEFALSILPTLIMMPSLLWNIQRNKERRDYQHKLLPVTVRALGLSRLSVFLLLSVLIASLFVFFSYLIPEPGLTGNKVVWFTFLTVVLLFCCYFILRDLLIYIIRNNRFLSINKEGIILMITIVVLILNVLGIYLFLSESRPAFDIIAGVMAVNPFAGPHGLLRLTITVGVLAVMCVFTFSKRKSYLE